MTKFALKQRSERNHSHLTYNKYMGALTTLGGFIMRSKVHKVLTIILYTSQVT